MQIPVATQLQNRNYSRATALGLVVILLFVAIPVIAIVQQIRVPAQSWRITWRGQQYIVRLGPTPAVTESVTTPGVATVNTPVFDSAIFGDAHRVELALQLLAALGNAQPSAETVAYVIAWSMAEDRGTDALNRNNPWNTTQQSSSVTMVINSDGVKGYRTIEDGIAMTALTLSYGYPGYADMREGLQTNDPERALRGLYASPWGTDADDVASIFHIELLPLLRQRSTLATKCGFTDTNQIGAGSGFWDTGSGYWSGQYGGMHLGVDLVGNPGDPVYAPWDMTIDSVGEYADPGRYGKNVQAHVVSDGYLFYAGHLIDVYVSAGQYVPACAVIGTLGATTGPHVHVKMASPAAPVPCEGSQPGPGGCVDPMAYWNTH